MKFQLTVLGVVLLGVTMLTASAFSAGSQSESTRPAPPPTDYSRAVKAVKQGDFRTAVRLLERVVVRDGGNADAFNYLGFSHRKLGDLERAMKFYRKALAIDPKHKGAHEYIGEAYLEKNELAKAKEHLAKLDGICWLGCEEYDDLKAAVKRYEAKRRS